MSNRVFEVLQQMLKLLDKYLQNLVLLEVQTEQLPQDLHLQLAE